MACEKTILCLANSRKLSGRCIAGKVWEGSERGRWVRPVSEREHEEVSEHERQYEDGRDPRILDIMRIPLLSPKPRDYQQENWLLDSKFYWVKCGRATWSDIAQLVDTIEPLWINSISTYNGINDKIPLDSADRLQSSLRLVHVDRLRVSVFKPGEAFGRSKRRVQGTFTHAGESYALWITDPLYENRFLREPDGEYGIGECYLTVSLGEAYKDACYKLIAAIIEPDAVNKP